MNDGRQTVLPEFCDKFSYYRTERTGSKTHLVAISDSNGSLGRTHCSMLNVSCQEIRSEYDVLCVARNGCQRCLSNLTCEERHVLALMATVAGTNELTADDIK